MWETRGNVWAASKLQRHHDLVALSSCPLPLLSSRRVEAKQALRGREGERDNQYERYTSKCHSITASVSLALAPSCPPFPPQPLLLPSSFSLSPPLRLPLFPSIPFFLTLFLNLSPSTLLSLALTFTLPVQAVPLPLPLPLPLPPFLRRRPQPNPTQPSPASINPSSFIVHAGRERGRGSAIGRGRGRKIGRGSTSFSQTRDKAAALKIIPVYQCEQDPPLIRIFLDRSLKSRLDSSNWLFCSQRPERRTEEGAGEGQREEKGYQGTGKGKNDEETKEDGLGRCVDGRLVMAY